MAGGDGVEVAYLVSQYPAPSHAFIEREIEGLRALGARVESFSVRSTPDELLLSPTMHREAQRTVVLQADRKAVLRDLGRLARTRPAAASAVLRRALGTGERTVRARAWQGFYYAEAVRLHAEMCRLGLRHIHVHFANNSADIARLVVALGRAVDGPSAGWRWSLSMHGPTEFEAVERFDLAAKVRSAHAVACISDFARSQLMRLVEPEWWDKLSIVRMSVDTDAYHAPAAGRVHGGPLRLLSVGRLVAEKGSPLLVDAIAALVRRGLQVQLRMAGAGELEPLLRERLARWGLERHVELMGAVSQDVLPSLYHWADVFCLPSFQEGLPVVLMEAMATELPVVTTSIAGVPELVADGVSGRLVVPGRADLFASAVEELAQDTDRRAAMGRAGRTRVVEEYSSHVVAPVQLQFLRSVPVHQRQRRRENVRATLNAVSRLGLGDA